VIAPAVVMRPSFWLTGSVNHRLPSLAATMPNGYALELTMGNSAIVPDGVMRPILLQPGSVNHRLPSGPDVMRLGPQLAVGSLNSVNTRHAVAALLQPFAQVVGVGTRQLPPPQTPGPLSVLPVHVTEEPQLVVG
jgi:hypothetical protein